MDQALDYLVIALDVAFLVCFAMLLWQFLLHKQWMIVLLSLFFAVVCGGSLLNGGVLNVGPGYLIAMVVGWQEAKNWKIQKLMRWYTGLFVLGFVIFAHSFVQTLTTASPPVDPKVLAKQKAAARQKAARP
jgi:hypothetical protein